MNKKHVGWMALGLFALSVMTVPLTLPKAYALDVTDNSAALNELEVPKSMYEMTANTPYSGAGPGEQISDVSGVLRRVETDFSLPGRNGLDVALSRLYESNTSNLWEPKATAQSVSGGYEYRNEREKYTYKERTYNLGAGWSFAFPSLELRGNASFLHFPDGSVYRTTASGSGLADYPLQDLTFAGTSETLSAADATGATVSAAAAYKLTDTAGKAIYFNSSGQWIGTKDAYGNAILVQYAGQPIFDGDVYPVISKIIDTLNREITFAYSDDTITVTYAPGKQIVYTKGIVSNEQKERYLASVTNENGETTTYQYDKQDGTYDFDTASGPAAESVPYMNLSRITYPTGARTVYTYTSAPASRHLGTNGAFTYYRVASRHDELNSKDQHTTVFDYSGNVDFTDPSLTSYTTKRTTISNPNAPSHIPAEEKIVVTRTLNNQHLVTRTVSEKTGEYKRDIDVTYDTAKKLAVGITETNSDYTVNPVATGTKTWAYTYDGYGNVLSATNPVGHLSAYTYSTAFPALPLTAQTTVAGVLVEDIAYTVDSAYPHVNQVTQSYTDEANQPATEQVTYAHDSYGNLTQVIRQLEGTSTQQTDIAYDSAYKSAYPTSVQRHLTVNGAPKTIEQRYSYELATGRVTKAYDGNAVLRNTPLASEQAYEYDAVGRITKITHPQVAGETEAGFKTFAFSYQPGDQQATLLVTDEEGKKSKRIYDGLGRPYKLQLQKISPTSGSVIFYDRQTNVYNDLGELAAVVDGEGHQTQLEYDASGRLKSRTSAEGRLLGFAYNDLTQSATTTTDYGETMKRVTDAIGRVTQTQRLEDGGSPGAALTTSYAYEVGGDPYTTQVTDANSAVVSFRNDGLNRLSSVTETVGVQSLNTAFAYNLLGNMTKKVFPDLSELSYSYDELGRRLSKTDSLNGSETYSYDDNSNVTGGTTRNGISVTNEYDELNRLKAWTSGNKSGSFTYYKNGLRKTMTDETGTTQYAYTPDNQLEKVTYPDGKYTQYTYYDNGLRKTMTDPFGKVIAYTYNQDNQLTQVTVDNAAQAQYVYRDQLPTTDPNYKKSSQLYQTKLAAGSLVTTYERDGYNRLSKLTQTGTGFTNDFTYTYDNNGNIVTRSDGSLSGTFTYDELNRITTSSEGSETYTYDGRGNRLMLESIRQEPHTDTMLYTYDDAEQLESVTRNGDTVTYKYNGDGLMTERTQTTGGVSTTSRYYYDGMNIIAEGAVTGSGATFKARYVRGGQLVYREDASGKAYYLHNGHGDVTELRQADSTLLNQYAYDIWGNPTVASGALDNPFRYAGEYWDETTELQYLRSRWYDPGIGRFIQEDTFEGFPNRPASMNPYAYVENNPLRYVDPFGHSVWGSISSFSSGAWNSGASAISNGIYNGTTNSGDSDTAYAVGQVVGGGVAAGVGLVETVIGAGGVGAGLATSETGVGALAVAPSATLAAHGVTTIGNAAEGIGDGIQYLLSDGTGDATSTAKKSRSTPTDTGTANSTKVDRDSNGNITKYTTYGPDGKIVKEVRIDGKDHGSIPRPNVKEPTFNTNPKTGKQFQNGYQVRPANPDEVPNSRK